MAGGDNHQNYIMNLPFREETKAEKLINSRHAELAYQYYKRAQELGGDPGEKLLKAKEDMDGYQTELKRKK